MSATRPTTDLADPARARPLRVGLVLPTLTALPREATLGWREHLALAQTAEAVGFDSIWVPDELLYRFDDAPERGWWECWTFLSAVAASTTRAELGTFVTCTNYRNPALLAKMAATVDEISGGRLILGLGAGWSERQFRTFGFPADHLFDRFEEALVVIRGWRREDRVTFEGRYHSARDAEILPAGPRPGAIPILIGARGQRGMRLAARYADAWNLFMIGGDCTPGRAAPFLAALDEVCAEVGRDPPTLQRSAGLMVALVGRALPGRGVGLGAGCTPRLSRRAGRAASGVRATGVRSPPARAVAVGTPHRRGGRSCPGAARRRLSEPQTREGRLTVAGAGVSATRRRGVRWRRHRGHRERRHPPCPRPFPPVVPARRRERCSAPS